MSRWRLWKHRNFSIGFSDSFRWPVGSKIHVSWHRCLKQCANSCPKISMLRWYKVCSLSLFGGFLNITLKLGLKRWWNPSVFGDGGIWSVEFWRSLNRRKLLTFSLKWRRLDFRCLLLWRCWSLGGVGFVGDHNQRTISIGYEYTVYMIYRCTCTLTYFFADTMPFSILILKNSSQVTIS